MITHYAHGKLLLTGEYFVLEGALALALPCKLGQVLQYETTNNNDGLLHWKALDNESKVWLEVKFALPDFTIKETNDEAKANKLKEILQACNNLSEHRFLNRHLSHNITTRLGFPLHWGLGSSSTLISNLSDLFSINAYQLNAQTFASSGYDIACAKNENPIFYRVYNDGTAAFSRADFNPVFKDKLFFVHLNTKQSSLSAIHAYRNIRKEKTNIIQHLSEISTIIAGCKDFDLFCEILNEHEKLIADFLNVKTVQENLFQDYIGTIKSLGAWGGDFVLACGEKNYVENYMKNKGYVTVIAYSELVY